MGPVNFLVQRFENPHNKKFLIHVNRLILCRVRPDRLKDQQSSSHTSLANVSETSANDFSFQVEDDSHRPLPPVSDVEIQFAEDSPDRSMPPLIDDMTTLQRYSPVGSTVKDSGLTTLSPFFLWLQLGMIYSPPPHPRAIPL